MMPERSCPVSLGCAVTNRYFEPSISLHSTVTQDLTELPGDALRYSIPVLQVTTVLSVPPSPAKSRAAGLTQTRAFVGSTYF